MVTLKDEMKRALEDPECENMRDVALVGSDGGEVPASKFALAVRSPVFRRMFFGQFNERESETVAMNYKAVVLRVVTKYCYLDELDLDEIYNDDSIELTDSEAVSLVELRDAARYLELSNLEKVVSNELADSILAHGRPSSGGDPSSKDADVAYICAVLQEIFTRGDTSEDVLWQSCMDFVEENPEECLLPVESQHNRGVMNFSLPTLLAVLTEVSNGSPFAAAKVLKKWHNGHHDTLNDGEKEQLRKGAEGVQLNEIASSDLAEIEPCKLFSMENLYGALVHQGQNSPTKHDPQKSFAETETVVTVRGAGVENANGVYRAVGGNNFTLTSEYGGIPCKFVIQQSSVEPWSLMAVLSGAGLEKQKQLILYKAQAA